MPEGIKHIIECHCVLPQYKNRPDIVYHRFVVFSEIDDSDTVLPKYVQCNNCGVVHKIVDVRRSEILAGTDELYSMRSIDDIQLTMPNDVSDVLNSYNCDLPTWENAEFILRNGKWGSVVVLTRDYLGDDTQGKLLSFIGPSDFKIESFINKSTIDI